ncbi:hypothetical protein J6590_096581 [Homalodisca vitripennis]|nr:hypothetical protein J6590_096581 [Homalodisca vitripennis]
MTINLTRGSRYCRPSVGGGGETFGANFQSYRALHFFMSDSEPQPNLRRSHVSKSCITCNVCVLYFVHHRGILQKRVLFSTLLLFEQMFKTTPEN